MSKTKKYSTIGTVMLAGVLIAAPLSSFAEQLYNRLTVQDAVDIMKENDLQTEITLEDDDLDRWRTAFTPAPGYTPPAGNQNASSWPAAYRTHVEPLKRQANDQQDDYQILSGELQRESASYAQLFNYWLLERQMEVNETNLELAKRDLRNTRTQHQQGQVSQNDVVQAEIGVNSAQVSFDESKQNFDQLKYQINQKLDQSIPADIEIMVPELTFIPQGELNADAVKQKIFNNHGSLGFTKKMLEAYTKGHEVVTGDNFVVGNDTLPVYLEREVGYWNLQLRQQRQNLEILAYSFTDNLKRLENTIRLHEENVKQGEKLYAAANRSFEQGMSTFSDVEDARLNLLNTNMQLASAQKDYMEAKEEFRLFQEGHVPSQGF